MDWQAWLQTALLVVVTLLGVSRWISTREHADGDAVKDIARHKAAIEKEIARLDAEIAGQRKRLHDVADVLQVIRVQIAVMETKADAARARIAVIEAKDQ